MLFTGRTVVTAGGGFRADVLVEGERAVAVGKDADIVLWKPDLETAATVVDYTPHGGVTFHGGLASVYVRGSLDYRDGEAVGERGSGGFIERSFAAPGQEARV